VRPVNLIPPDQRRGDKAPARTGRLPWLVVGGAFALLLLVFLTVSTGSTVTERKAEVAALEQREADARTRAESLRAFADFASLQAAREETVSSLARSRFDWERVLREFALILPDGVSLDTFGAGLGEDVAATTGGMPTITFAGCGADSETLAALTRALEDIDGVTKAGIMSATSSSAAGGGGAGAESGCQGLHFEAEATFDAVSVDPTTMLPVFPEEAPTSADEAIADAAGEIEQATELIPGVE
jgi:Tfp pilus assembly protein PilN